MFSYVWVFSWGCFLGIPVIKTWCSLGALMWPATWADPSLPPTRRDAQSLAPGARRLLPLLPPPRRGPSASGPPGASAGPEGSDLRTALTGRLPPGRPPAVLRECAFPARESTPLAARRSEPPGKPAPRQSASLSPPRINRKLEPAGRVRLRLQRARSRLPGQTSPPSPRSAAPPPTPGSPPPPPPPERKLEPCRQGSARR